MINSEYNDGNHAGFAQLSTPPEQAKYKACISPKVVSVKHTVNHTEKTPHLSWPAGLLSLESAINGLMAKQITPAIIVKSAG